MSILLKGGRVIDPVSNIDKVMDILVEGGVIAEAGDLSKYYKSKDIEIYDASGKAVTPGLIDIHAHLREPGFEYKEDIASGTRAAAAGGFTTVFCMPNTNPVNDNRAVTEYILKQAAESGACRVIPIGAITKGSLGALLTEMGDMSEAGCPAFSDDGKPVASSEVMRRALEYAKTFGLTIISHCEDPALSAGGVMNEGAVSTRLGLKGIPSAAEDVMVARDIELAKLTGGRLHLAHVSTAGSVGHVRRAKAAGVSVTAETCPHYFTLTDEAVSAYNTNFKVNPPLRTAADMEAVILGLADGTLDVIATDHAPHAASEKAVEFDLAPFGISGFETALALSLRLVETGRLSLKEVIEKLTVNPAKALGMAVPSLAPGARADVTVIDLGLVRTFDPADMLSKGKNTAYAGMTLTGWPVATMSGGAWTFKA
ncbi:MAG: dihydroorotase [Nitrospirae bacterium]|nr:dihydroorotase [Nitrospirota bacterium]